MLILVALLGIVVLASICARLSERGEPEPEPAHIDERSPAQRAAQALRARARARRSLPPLPHGHRPPAGLGPLSPSERFLRSESARGIRELRAWMLDDDGAVA